MSAKAPAPAGLARRRNGARQDVHLRLTSEQYAAVNDLARSMNMTQAQVIRSAVDDLMAKAGYAK